MAYVLLNLIFALLLASVNGRFDGNFTLRSMQGRLSEQKVSSMIHCVSNDGKPNKIQFSRVLDTGQGPNLPKYSQLFDHGNPLHARILLLPSEDGLINFGAFQCQIINGGINTTVTTLKLPPLSKVEIDAKEPYISVSKGDTVELKMVKHVKHNLSISWAHNGQEKPEWENQLEVKMVNVDITAGGIYECYYKGRRSEGLHGLLRLIVRACPAGKFGNFCNRECPECYNGGICHDFSGECICPPGFTGKNCEIACGGNLFGAKCEKKCIIEEQETGCAHHVFCKPDPYGCSCPPGYKGPKCGDACEAGRYGADCKQYCHCPNDEACNTITGKCRNGCATNWKGNSCQIYVENTEVVTDSNIKDPCEPGKFGENCNKRCHCFGGEQCDRVTGACKGKCEDLWNGTACNECIDGRFGENCEHICHCENGDLYCNKTSGECDTVCEAGWSGFNCQEGCPSNKFGVNCMNSCECQNNGHCNKINGTCTCIDIWRGKNCTDRIPRILVTSNGEETNAGQYFVISCIAEAIPSPSMKISSRDIQNFGTLQRDFTTKHQYQAASNVTVSTAGNVTFECTATNAYGFDIKPFIVRVIDPPILRKRPEVIEVLSTTISVTWHSWVYGKDSGGKEDDRVDYLVLFRQLGTTDWTHNGKWIPNTSTVINSLVPDTEYEIAVKCRRPGKGGEGKHSLKTLVVRTQCGTALANAIPRNFQTDHVAPNSVVLSWKPPLASELQCSLTGYMLRYYQGIHVHDLSYINISASHQVYILEGLVPHTDYVFNLFAITSKGKVRNYAELKISTPPDVPGLVQELEYKLLLDPSSIVITWNESAIKNGIIERYRITYRLVRQGLCDKPSNSTNIQESLIIEVPERKGALKGLLPYSIYNISVQASTSAGYGEPNTIIVETLQSTPSSPQNVHTITINSTELEFSWSPIACDKANGKITGYEYGLKNVSGLGNKKHARQRRGTDVWIVPLNKSQDTKVILTSLTPYNEYGFIVRAHTKVGPGPFSEMLYVRTADDIPPPPGIRILSTSNETLTVNWDLPSPPHGIIIKFRFHLWPVDNQRNITSYTIIYDSNSENLLQHTFKNLEPFKQYFVKIQGATRVGWGEWSETVSKWTKEGIPGPPSNITVTSHTNASVTISWSPPKKTNGIIQKYKVSYHSISLIKTERQKVDPMELDNATLQAVFNRLQPNTEYSFSVWASTKVGDGKSTEILYWTNYAGSLFPPTAEVLENETTNNTISIRFPAGHSGVIKYQIIVEDARNAEGIDESKLTDYYGSVDKEVPYYIAGELIASHLPEQNYYHFVIGDKNMYGGYPNVPLSRGVFYNIRILTVIRQNGREKAAVSVPRKYRIVSKEDGMVAKKTMFGLSWLHFSLVMIGILVLVVIILFSIGVGICRYRHLNKKKKNCFTIHDPAVSDAKTWSVVYKVSDYEATDSPLVNDSNPIDFEFDNASTMKMKKIKKDSNAGYLHINDLTEFVYGQNLTSCRNFSEEFEKLSHGQYSTFQVARKPENVRKNRYGNILPYDHSRVILKPIPDVSTSDYINASYIDGYNRSKEYISTQGPKENTILDFWRMIWQENVTVIVMVTGLVENGKRKCSKYWPDDSILYGDLQILLSHTEPCMDFIIRTLLLRKASTGETRRIRHYQFLDWPDHTVPLSAASLLTMLRRMRTENSNLTGPIVVHCSAGIGRSGTFIAIDSLWQQSQRENHVNVLAFVNKLRMQRTNMVQNLEQYAFIYETLVEAIQCGNTAVMANELPIYIRELCLIKPDMEISELEFQYMALSSANMKVDMEQCSDALSEVNIFKNRDPMIVPTNNKRLKLSSTNEEGGNYINAVAVDGYKHKNAFLVTQMPLSHTVNDFWKMIYEYNSSLVVMLNDSWKADTCEDKGQYWPSEGGAQYGQIEVQVVTFEDQGSIMIRIMKLINTRNPNEEPHRLIQLQYMDWAYNDLLPANSASMLALLNQVDRWYRRTTGGPITVHCMDGAERCGVFCAVNYICDQLKTEHIVDVFHAVKKIRTSRPEFISSLEQFKFCYEVAMELVDSYSIYSNFKLSH